MSGRYEVAIIGSGPAGVGLAAECARRGVSTVLIGPDDSWSATYGMWADEVDETLVGRELGSTMFASVAERVIAYGTRRHEIDRRYAVLANDTVRRHLLDAVDHRPTRVEALEEHVGGVRLVTTEGLVRAERVVDAAGLGQRAVDPTIAWQTAYGIVIPTATVEDHRRRTGVGLETVFMDWREIPGAPDLGLPTFCYVVEVDGGWLVEETVLSSAPAVEPDALAQRLSFRLEMLGLGSLVDLAGGGRTEIVRIPMDMAPVAPTDLIEPFGAAAGLTHPATGFSVAASWRLAGPVAAAIASGRSIDSVLRTRRSRATQALYRYGAAVIDDLDGGGVRGFFDVFFERPVEVWAPFLKVDTRPGVVARTMLSMFAAAPWSTRRALVRRPMLRQRRSTQVAGSFSGAIGT